MNEETIFAQAIQIADAGERQAFVDKVCADDAKLRADVDALLKSHAQARSFLEVPALEASRPTVISDVEADNGTTAIEDDLRFLRPSDSPDSMGRLGQYEVLSEIGRGGLGVVLKARDAALGRIVAIKVPASEYAANALVRKRFMREAQAAAAVSHDHVVTIHAVGEENGIPYLVMELVDGISLQQKIDNEGPLELKEILRIGSQTACGLAAAHKQGLVHRDVKPANVLLENGVQRVKLTDFGLARAVDDVSITQTGTVAGTPQYMSPEQAHGRQVDHRSDLFSLGSVLYAMCTGRPAFRADSTMAVLKRVCDDAPKPIRNVNTEVPEWLCEIVEKLLEKEPNDRFQSAEEVAELLNRHLAHLQQPESVPQPAPIRPSTRDLPRRGVRSTNWFLIGIGILFLVAMVVGFSGLVNINNAPGGAELAVILFVLAGMFALPVGLVVWIVFVLRRAEARAELGLPRRETKPSRPTGRADVEPRDVFARFSLVRTIWFGLMMAWILLYLGMAVVPVLGWFAVSLMVVWVGLTFYYYNLSQKAHSQQTTAKRLYVPNDVEASAQPRPSLWFRWCRRYRSDRGRLAEAVIAVALVLAVGYAARQEIVDIWHRLHGRGKVTLVLKNPETKVTLHSGDGFVSMREDGAVLYLTPGQYDFEWTGQWPDGADFKSTFSYPVGKVELVNKIPAMADVVEVRRQEPQQEHTIDPPAVVDDKHVSPLVPKPFRGTSGLSMQVLDAEGRASLPRACVILSKMENGQAVFRHTVFTDDAGQLHITGLREGYWMVSISPESDEPQRGHQLTLQVGVVHQGELRAVALDPRPQEDRPTDVHPARAPKPESIPVNAPAP